jgi:hypothetical protein
MLIPNMDTKIWHHISFVSKTAHFIFTFVFFFCAFIILINKM